MKARLPQGMGGGPQNINQMIRQAQKMQEQMQALQEELNAREYEVSAGGGMVKIKINGERRILSVSIDPDIVDPDDVETLEDIITAGVNEAIKLVDDTNTAEMNRLTGGLGLPGGLF
ncbi:MAG: YbaB/EbfC family nucleoid-associated protein [Clostridiales bacterium]|nr:YbaB/EbfC family nucleoid-associated protein [Clostridiales bacterium]